MPEEFGLEARLQVQIGSLVKCSPMAQVHKEHQKVVSVVKAAKHKVVKRCKEADLDLDATTQISLLSKSHCERILAGTDDCKHHRSQQDEDKTHTINMDFRL